MNPGKHEPQQVETERQVNETSSESQQDNTDRQVKEVNTSGLELPKAPKDKNSQTITHIGYTVSYNTNLLIPNWVAYELTGEEVVGEVERSNDFNVDPDVRGRCSTTDDYKRSGYDRGHMAPAADMKWSKQAMEESFYTTNICPQNHNLNAGDWKELEEQVRDWAIKNDNIYVVCGPIMGNSTATIGENGVAVPEAFFKVVLMQKDGSWRSLGFVFENKAGNKPLDTYTKSVDEIERITKLDFFHKLPDNIENKIEKNSSFDNFEN
ncbi:MAG: DNA/RNA non-specific endonuclease [Bacteroidales bacterium]|nr:DNA/RNA non-specific endonuclease [Bacteroidales bacterium]